MWTKQKLSVTPYDYTSEWHKAVHIEQEKCIVHNDGPILSNNRHMNTDM